MWNTLHNQEVFGRLMTASKVFKDILNEVIKIQSFACFWYGRGEFIPDNKIKKTGWLWKVSPSLDPRLLCGRWQKSATLRKISVSKIVSVAQKSNKELPAISATWISQPSFPQHITFHPSTNIPTAYNNWDKISNTLILLWFFFLLINNRTKRIL